MGQVELLNTNTVHHMPATQVERDLKRGEQPKRMNYSPTNPMPKLP